MPRISLPPGFATRIFAGGLSGRPRLMAFGPDGAMYISDDHGMRIYRVVYAP